MLVGYVSDERYIALDGVRLEFEDGNTPIEAQFDNSFENIGHPRSNYAHGIGFASS